MNHSSTRQQRIHWVSEMIAHEGNYGLVSQMSKHHGISRQTLYTLKTRGQRAMERELSPKEQEREEKQQIERAVLTLFTEAHASYRGIQVCLQVLLGIHVSLGTITKIIQHTGKRAQEWLEQHMPEGMRALALDEQYSSKRGEAYLNIVDVYSALVLASVAPVAVDGESWKLLLWQMREQGLKWHTIVSDGGRAIQDAVQDVTPEQVHQRDVWHVLHECQKVQKRLDRLVEQLQEQEKTVKKQAARVAAGQKPRGANPKCDVQVHAACLAQARYVANSLRYLTEELKRLLEVVVLAPTARGGVLPSQVRDEELQALVALFTELWQAAPVGRQEDLKKLCHHVQLALPHLVGFTRSLDSVQQAACQQIGAEALYLIGWAWQHRAILEPKTSKLIAALPPDWHESAAAVLCTWDEAVRASSAVENWHSVLRPFLAVHRSLSAGMLSILALWHNHRVAPRGKHFGQSPMQRSGLQKQATDWLVALGYPPVSPAIQHLVAVKSEQDLAA